MQFSDPQGQAAGKCSSWVLNGGVLTNLAASWNHLENLKKNSDA